MSHPYSGPASYIYAQHLEKESVPLQRESYQRQARSKPSWSSSISPPSTMVSRSPVIPSYHYPIRASASVPQFSTDFQSSRYKQFSMSSYVASPTRHVQNIEPYAYETMRVRFDTPNEHILAWRRKMKVIKQRISRIRRDITKMVTHNWITSPRPRLSMIS